MTARPQVELPELLVRGVIASMQTSSRENTRGWADVLLRAVDFDAEALATRLAESEARTEGAEAALDKLRAEIAGAAVATVQENRGYMKDCSYYAPAPRSMDKQRVALLRLPAGEGE